MDHPGTVLKRDFLDPLGISPWALSKGIGVHVSRITRIIQGERPITLNTAVRLGLFFNVPARWWLDLQTEYELANSELANDLVDVVQPYDRLHEVVVTPSGARPLSRPAPSAKPQTKVSTALLERLKKRASKTQPDEATATAEHVTYDNGFQALVRK